MISKIDFGITTLVILLLIIGLAAVYSATSFSGSETDLFTKQLLVALLGILLMLGIPYIPYRFIQRIAFPFYGLSILLLIIVYFFGARGFGAERWLTVGPVKIQPSELAKLATVLAVARYLSNRDAGINKLKNFSVVTGLIVLPMLLIVRQPDLGTALVFAALLIPILFWAGLKWFPLFMIISPFFTMILSFNYYAFAIWIAAILAILYFSRKKVMLIISILVLHAGVGFVTPMLWDQLQPYQKGRILTFIDPERDPKGAGYQIIQSQVAIGSGGIWGKGFMKGTRRI